MQSLPEPLPGDKQISPKLRIKSEVAVNKCSFAVRQRTHLRLHAPSAKQVHCYLSEFASLGSLCSMVASLLVPTVFRHRLQRYLTRESFVASLVRLGIPSACRVPRTSINGVGHGHTSLEPRPADRSNGVKKNAPETGVSQETDADDGAGLPGTYGCPNPDSRSRGKY